MERAPAAQDDVVKFGSLQQVKDAVEEHGGILTVRMLALREAHGAERLGSLVRDEIATRLQQLGLAYQPDPLPRYQEEEARLYTRDGKVAELINAARQVGPRHDAVLRQAAGNTSAEIIDRIRELIGN